MSLALLVTINALADIVLLVGLACAMSRTTLLKAHVGSPRALGQSSMPEQALASRQSPRPTRFSPAAGTWASAPSSSHAGRHAAAAWSAERHRTRQERP